MLHSCIKGFSTGQKTLGESAEGGEGKALTELRLQPTFKNKIGESSLDIHRFLQFAARLPIEVNQIADGVEPSVTGRMHGAK